MIPLVGAWVVFLVLSLIGWFFCCICCACDKCCPPSKCCRRDLDRRPYNSCEQNWPLYGGTIACLIILGSSIAGLSTSGNLAIGIKTFRCSVVKLIGDLVYGLPSGQTASNG